MGFLSDDFHPVRSKEHIMKSARGSNGVVIIASKTR
jgi:hypothetical protein